MQSPFLSRRRALLTLERRMVCKDEIDDSTNTLEEADCQQSAIHG
jgi:hypothetical protein